MSLVLNAGPAIEPVSVAEAKAHLRVDSLAEDVFIASLVVTSRLHIEAALGAALITQSWSYFLDRWPASRDLELPMRPVQSIAALRLYRPDDTFDTAATADYILDGSASPARLAWRAATAPPRPGRRAKGIEVAFVAGFGPSASDVPATIRQALLLLIAHWYENREPVEIGAGATPIPAMINDLLAPFRTVRL